MKLNRFSKSAAVVLLVLGSGGIASARYLQDPNADGPPPGSRTPPGEFAPSVEDSGPTPTGGLTPASGRLHENWNRIYGSTTGRYLQADPAWRERANYPYAANSPLLFADPDGRDISWDLSTPYNATVVFNPSPSCSTLAGVGNYTFYFSPPNSAPRNTPFGPITLPTSTRASIIRFPGGLPLPPSPTSGTIQTQCCQQDNAAYAVASGMWFAPPIYNPLGYGPGLSPDDFVSAVRDAFVNAAASCTGPQGCPTPSASGTP